MNQEGGIERDPWPELQELVAGDDALRRYLELSFRAFHATGDWPDVEKLQRHLLREREDIDLYAVGDRIPVDLGTNPVRVDNRCQLSIAGVALCDDSGGSTTYSYDAADRLSRVVGTSTTTYSYDAADQLASKTTGNKKVTYSYDADGNRTGESDLRNSYGYDQANRLISFGTANTYSYDGDGLRTKKIVSGTAETFVYDMADGLPLMIRDGSTYYVSGPGGLPLEQISGTTVNYYHQDQLGSTRLITNSSGGTVNTYSYDAYGNVTASTGTLSNPFRVAGQYLDSETGFYYLRARYYDPATGQFISRDPLASLTGEPYAYVTDNPLNAADPTGLEDVIPWEGAAGGTAVASCLIGPCELFIIAGAGGYVMGLVGAHDLETADPWVVSAARWVGLNILHADDKTVAEHGWEKHEGDLKDIGIESQDDLEQRIEDLKQNKGCVEQSPLRGGGRIWRGSDGIIVIDDGQGGGTALAPPDPKGYFDRVIRDRKSRADRPWE